MQRATGVDNPLLAVLHEEFHLQEANIPRARALAHGREVSTPACPSRRNCSGTSANNLLGVAVLLDLAVGDPYRPFAEVFDGGHVVGDEDNGPPPTAQFTHRSQALLLKTHVSDCQHFVDKEHVRAQVGGHRETQPHAHTARVPFDGRVQILRDVGELDDPVHHRVGFPLLHAQDRAVQIDVLATRELIMESRSDLE